LSGGAIVNKRKYGLANGKGAVFITQRKWAVGGAWWLLGAAWWRRKKVARVGGGGSESQLNAAGKLLFVYYPCIPIPSPSPFPFRPTFRRVCVCPAGLLSPSILCNQPVFWHSGSKFPSPHSSYQLLSPFNLPSPVSHLPSTIPHQQPPKNPIPSCLLLLLLISAAFTWLT